MPKLPTLSGVRWFLGCFASYVCLRLQSRGLVNQEVWFTSVLGQPRVWFTSGVGEPRVCLTGCLGEPRFGSRGKSGRAEAVPMSVLACILQWKCASTFSMKVPQVRQEFGSPAGLVNQEFGSPVDLVNQEFGSPAVLETRFFFSLLDLRKVSGRGWGQRRGGRFRLPTLQVFALSFSTPCYL